MLVLNPLHAEVKQVFAHVLHESETDRYWDRLNHLATMAKKHPQEARMFWAKYHNFKEMFATIRYCYCITVHRSQGSTYRKVFVDLNNILKNNIRAERQRLAYVAFSRPSEELLINKGKYVA
jgi:exodeoxyribonuclease-5